MAEPVQGFCVAHLRELEDAAWRGLGAKERCVSIWAGLLGKAESTDVIKG